MKFRIKRWWLERRLAAAETRWLNSVQRWQAGICEYVEVAKASVKTGLLRDELSRLHRQERARIQRKLVKKANNK